MRNPWIIHEESTESLHGIHETVFHGVLMESSIFQTVPLDSMWSLHRLHMDSSWSLWRLLELIGNAPMGFHGVLMESSWSLRGVLMGSM
jgi:hypothetical protein